MNYANYGCAQQNPTPFLERLTKDFVDKMEKVRSEREMKTIEQ